MLNGEYCIPGYLLTYGKEKLPFHFLIICPAPEQVGQPLSTVKKPWVARTLPNPEHVGHVVGEDPPAAPVPLQDPHATEEGTFIVFCSPAKASSREIDKL